MDCTATSSLATPGLGCGSYASTAVLSRLSLYFLPNARSATLAMNWFGTPSLLRRCPWFNIFRRWTGRSYVLKNCGNGRAPCPATHPHVTSIPTCLLSACGMY